MSPGPLPRWLVAPVLGGLVGLGGHLFLPASLTIFPGPGASASPRTDGGSDAFVEANALLNCYAARLGELSAVVGGFSKATFGDTEELKRAAEPLRKAIKPFNDAYTEIYRARPRLTVDLLDSARNTGAIDRILCRLSATDRYQWEELRPELNTLLVNIIAAWRENLEDERLDEVRRQQQSKWLELQERLAQGAKDFSSGAPKADCAAAGTMPSRSQ